MSIFPLKGIRSAFYFHAITNHCTPDKQNFGAVSTKTPLT